MPLKLKNHDSSNYTSQVCPNCGVNTGRTDLSQRLYVCPECRYEQDRDVAAAEVVMKRGVVELIEALTAVGAPVVK